MAASVRQRLLNVAHERNESFDLTLTKFGLEWLLYRISQFLLRARRRAPVQPPELLEHQPTGFP